VKERTSVRDVITNFTRALQNGEDRVLGLRFVRLLLYVAWARENFNHVTHTLCCTTKVLEHNNSLDLIAARTQVPEDECVSTTQVTGYNNYTCSVFELYCKKCNLFLGHKFEDAKEKGDTSVDAHWRH